nr:MAG TPA: hypothetical protein [Caudoviricetes sp.]
MFLDRGSIPLASTILYFLIHFNLFKNLSRNTTRTIFDIYYLFKLFSIFLNLFNCL